MRELCLVNFISCLIIIILKELAQLVVTHMENNGIELIRGASPVKVEEFYENSRRKLKVTYSDSQEDKREVSGRYHLHSKCILFM